MSDTARDSGGRDLPDVVVLAGGLGTRLRGVVSDRPKVLAPVRGRPFLAYLLDWLSAAGAGRVILAVGYLADAIRDAVGVRHGALDIHYVVEAEPLGTAGALANAAPAVETDEVLILNGDSIVLADLTAVTQRHREADLDVTMVTVLVEDCSRFGRVRVDAAGKVSTFGEKAGHGPGYINAGVYVLTRALMADLPRPASLERDVLPGLAGRGRVLAFPCEAPFIDMGTPEAYELLRTDTERFFPGC